MKPIVKISILLLFVALAPFDTSAQESTVKGDNSVPHYQGGEEAMNAFLDEKLERFKNKAAENNIAGTVYVKFKVQADGSLTNIDLIKGFDKKFDKAALKAVKKMPKWIPARRNGESIDAFYRVAIKFP